MCAFSSHDYWPAPGHTVSIPTALYQKGHTSVCPALVTVHPNPSAPDSSRTQRCPGSCLKSLFRDCGFLGSLELARCQRLPRSPAGLLRSRHRHEVTSPERCSEDTEHVRVQRLMKHQVWHLNRVILRHCSLLTRKEGNKLLSTKSKAAYFNKL